MEGGRQEIGLSEEEEAQEESKGFSQNSHRCKGYVESRRIRRGYVQCSHNPCYKGTNGIGHAEVILKTCEDAGCDVIGLQEVRRNGQSAFTAAEYVVFFAQEQTEKSTKRRGTTG